MTAAVPVDDRMRRRFWVWSALMAAMLSLLAFAVAPRLRIDTDILALLPANRDAAVEDALQRLSSALSQRQLFLIGAADAESAQAAARRFAAALSSSEHFTSVQAEVGGDLRAVANSYRAYWPYLLSDADRARLQTGDANSLYDDALRAVYTPVGLMRRLPLAEDPLGLVGNFLQQQLPAMGSARVDGAMLMAARDERHFALVASETRESAFSADAQDRVLPVIDAATTAARENADVEVLSSGALQHAVAATRRAKAEIGAFGTIETVAVLALLFFVFGNIRPLALGALVLGLSIGAAMTVSHFVFGKLHIMALVFGASLIGVVIDYSMHFLADRFRLRESWTPAQALSHVGPAILLGMSITLLGYFGLVLMPFPGLRQIAAFCMIGIVVGCGSVLCLYPYLMSSRWLGGGGVLPERGPRAAAALDRFLANWRWTRAKAIACGVLAATVAVGLAQLKAQDDIRALQSSPPELLEAERRVQEIVGGGVETRFFLVQAADAQALLEREEALRAQLDPALQSGELGSYAALTRALPSLRRQSEDHALLAREVYRPGGAYPRLMSQLGFSAAQNSARLAQFAAAKPLEPDAWLATPAAGPHRHLWLGKIGSHFASVVTLSGIRDVERLHNLTAELAGVRLVDRPREVSGVMSTYRQATAWLLIFANGAALLVLSLRFGWRDGARMALPSAAACLVTLGLFGWLGVSVNLFNVFALLLVLALGVDYGIFLRHGQHARMTAILSVTLSACTTLIGFGMLAFSVTPFIRSIGLTLLCGIAFSWLFVMLSCMTHGRAGADAAKG